MVCRKCQQVLATRALHLEDREDLGWVVDWRCMACGTDNANQLRLVTAVQILRVLTNGMWKQAA